MKFSAALLLPLLALATANPLPAPEPEALPAADPAAALDALNKRDKYCKVFTGDGNVACRKGAGTGYNVVRRIGANDRFGVNCKANGEKVGDTKVWDWVPGWGCWVTAYYTRGVDGNSCESGVPWC
ncbi:hypothetical protein EJ06DRAFT_558568 [Trichodelitschia bisporula]|uniref:SH3b domain-containing protein n=1 Tax=Trichodelitschia bisporula TaxID=703511 RepID=A0A6G1HQ87_9PEZI|nr:hypothetical protein EJ06DRAFT_558568 [Trichodelitschia bisporula]